MTPFARIGTGLALLCIGGCGDLPISNVTYSDSYHPGETKSSGPDMVVVVRGNPFSIAKPELNSAVVDAMQGWSAWQDHFTDAGNPNAPYRVVMVFNPTSNVGSETYCARPLVADGATAAAPSARVSMVAALCRGGSYLSYVDGSVPVAGGPRDTAFRNAVGRAALLLFPAQNPQANGSDCGEC
jgi:hypothetical protein